ncbi:MAG: hypothetical protein MK078_03620 [Crocinitomicaceae bacterium]|nr:hypothetical protein [Crocinitomicaceae bacterium]
MRFLIAIFSIIISPLAFCQYKVKKIDDLPKRMYETSGVLWYDNKYVITHNDGGNKSEFFLLDEEGKLKKTINVKDTKNKDWEDIAKDDKGNIYIGDVGNNLNKRKDLCVYKIEKGFVKKEDVDPEKISFYYPDQKKFPPKKEEMNFDCEAMIWKGGFIYLFTKCRAKPFTGISNIYRIPDKPGDYEAAKVGQLNLCKLGWRSCSITAADYDPEQNILLLLTYTKLYIISDFQGVEFWKGKKKTVDLTFIKQREAICVKDENTLYMTDEHHSKLGGGNLYEIRY